MSDSMARAILGILAASKGCSIVELTKALHLIVLPVDDIREGQTVRSLLFPPIAILMKWNLVEAYYGDEAVDLTTLWDDQYDPCQFSFYISPIAVEMENALGLNLISTYKPIFGEPKQRASWFDIFVLMPFAENLAPVFEDHIKKVVARLGRSVGRADDFFSGGAIIQDIWSAIFHSSVIIADCTDRNPNVFYEIGIAHTLGRDTILLTQSLDDIPFDLRHLRIIEYQFTPRGMQRFEETLSRTLQTMK